VSKPLQLVRSTQEEAPRSEAEKASFISELFERARRGDIPRGRELHTWEPNLLNERHLQAVMMRCMGMKQKDIAISLGYTDSTVSIVLNHPDAHWLIDQLQGLVGVGVTDIDARLKRLTPRAVDAIEEVFDDDCSDPKQLQARVQKARMGFALLEHTQPKATQRVEHDHRVSLQPAAAHLISRALRESSQIEDATYVTIPSGSGGGVEGSGPPTTLPSGTETPPLGGLQSHSLPHDLN
jgi:transcriptional regulator